MPTLVTATTLKTHVKTALTDAALDRILDDLEDTVNRRFGPLTGAVERRAPEQLTDILWLSRIPSTISAVSERVGTTTTALAADDYEQKGRRLRRLTTGTNSRSEWGDYVDVTYDATDDTNNRVMAIIDAARVEVEYRAATSETVGDFSKTYVDMVTERNRILARLRKRVV